VGLGQVVALVACRMGEVVGLAALQKGRAACFESSLFAGANFELLAAVEVRLVALEGLAVCSRVEKGLSLATARLWPAAEIPDPAVAVEAHSGVPGVAVMIECIAGYIAANTPAQEPEPEPAAAGQVAGVLRAG
jgi:hypothetical protein